MRPTALAARHAARRLVLFLVLAAVVSCGGDDGDFDPFVPDTDDEPSAPTVSGLTALTAPGDQTVGGSLNVEVRVDGSDGAPMAGVSVAFSAGSGGSVAPTSATTGSAGTASTTWTFGTTAGQQTLQASASGRSTAVTATVLAEAAAQVMAVSGDGQTGVVNAGLHDPIIVSVQDAFGNAVADATVTFVVTSGGGTTLPTSATTGSDGLAATNWTLGAMEGTQTLEARSGSLTAAAFSATGTAESTGGGAANMAKEAGDDQTATAGTAVAVAPAVKVTDANGDPVAGVTVTYAVASGGGSVTDATPTTGSDGVAAVGSWTLGASAGTNTLTASADGVSSVTFTATGSATQSAYDMEIRIVGTVPDDVQAALDSAEARWEEIITGDLPATLVQAAAGECENAHPAVDETVDDLLIFVEVKSMDGAGNTLAAAGECLVRDSGLAALGSMDVDADDLGTMRDEGTLMTTVLHEIGHILGIGNLWEDKGFLQGKGTANPTYSGTQGVAQYQALGGSLSAIPVENEGGEGTADSHWRTSVFGTEVMVGFSSPAPNPLSIMTIGALLDLGYEADLGKADDYSIPSSSSSSLVLPRTPWEILRRAKGVIGADGVRRNR